MRTILSLDSDRSLAVRHRAPVKPWVTWWGIFLLLTLVMHHVRGDLAQVHVVLAYLLVILGGSASGGRGLGVVLACMASLLIDYFFQPPYDHLSVGSLLDWDVLVTFLATALVTTQLLARARERATEIAHVARLGSETLGSGRAEDALPAMAAVIRDVLEVDRCTIVPVEHGAPGVTQNLDGRHLEFVLRVHGRTVGLLQLDHGTPIRLTAAQQRVLEALIYYAALATERVRLIADAEHTEALREADRLKDAVLASVSHDLRTPLATIKALAQASVEEGDARAIIIEEQADRLSRLVTDLLDLSRIKGNAFPMDVQMNTVEDLLGAAMRQLAGAIGSRVVRKSVDYAQPVLAGQFDFVQSLRIVSNLLENALRYSPADLPIEIGVQRVGSDLLVSVADRGPGLPAADRERVFEPFYRGPSASPDTGGAGLGLAIARQLAEAQGGRVTYEPRPGGGSVFTLRLPAIDVTALPSDEEVTEGL